MAVYNGEKYLKQQIDSILYQLDNNDELIISDDGSEDETLNIIKNYHDKRIVLLFHDRKRYTGRSIGSKYASANFENALKYARGDIIILSDQDDIWLDGKKEEFVNFLSRYDMVMCNFSLINTDGRVVCDKYYASNPISNCFLMNVMRSRFLGCCMAFNKKILKWVLPFPENLVGHDYWIGCIGVSLGSFCFIDRVLHAYRRHDDNVTTATNRSTNHIFYKIYYRIDFLFKLVRRFIVIFNKKNQNYFV
jgi:glycosyltransferase involved in cell wall biosynthesis